MKRQSRELLVTTKAAQHWREDFDQQIDELMTIVTRLDTEASVLRVTEVLDVYHHHSSEDKPRQKGRARRKTRYERPFEMLVFRN